VEPWIVANLIKAMIECFKVHAIYAMPQSPELRQIWVRNIGAVRVESDFEKLRKCFY
jgi:hypothetical protein